MNEAKQIALKLQKIWKKCYIVGGYIRDKMLGRPLWDIDLATDASPSEVREILDVKSEIGSKYWTLIILENGKTFEITSFRKDIWSVNNRKPAEVEFWATLEEDAARRDFTMNAIYYDILEDEYIDPFFWTKDILDGKIRFIWDASERLDEDILRALRFVRFKNKYNLEVLEEDFEIIKSKITLLQNISSNRIKDELDKILVDTSNISALNDLRLINFIWEIFSYITISETLEHFKVLNEKEVLDADLYYVAIFLHLQFFEDYLSSMPFSNKSKKKIRQILNNFESLYFFESLDKLSKAKLFTSDFIEESLMLINKYKIEKEYLDFKELYQYVTLPTAKDVLADNPELKGKELWEKIKEEQNKLLIWLL